MAQSEAEWAEGLFRAYLSGDLSEVGPMVHTARRMFGILPGSPRCKVCDSPFSGVGGFLTGMMGYGAGPGTLNPTLCVKCENIVKKHEVGIELEVTLMFADVRGSTTLAQQMSPAEFHHLIDRFYREATEAMVGHGALIEKLIGDEVAGIFVPGIAGEDHSCRAVEAAIELLERTGHAGDQPWVPVGAGVHTGTAYVGAVGASQAMNVITVLGDTANTAARLASNAFTGEILVSEAACEAGAEAPDHETRELALKGRAEALGVRVMRV